MGNREFLVIDVHPSYPRVTPVTRLTAGNTFTRLPPGNGTTHGYPRVTGTFKIRAPADEAHPRKP